MLSNASAREETSFFLLQKSPREANHRGLARYPAFQREKRRAEHAAHKTIVFAGPNTLNVYFNLKGFYSKRRQQKCRNLVHNWEGGRVPPPPPHSRCCLLHFELDEPSYPALLLLPPAKTLLGGPIETSCKLVGTNRRICFLHWKGWGSPCGTPLCVVIRIPKHPKEWSDTVAYAVG